MTAHPAHDYFSLQLRFAGRYAALAGVPFDAAISSCTNLRRRFGLWGPDGEAQWAGFLETVRARPEHGAVLGTALQLLDARPPAAPSPFGCFSHDAPDAHGTLRLHFMPDARHRGFRPLAADRLPERRAELQALVRHVQRAHPDTREVRGLSWLYHLPAYRGLFPAAYAASVKPATGPLHMNGSSAWGQVLDHQHGVKPGMADRVLAGLTAGTVEVPWRAFPLQPLAAACPAAEFFAGFC